MTELDKAILGKRPDVYFVGNAMNFSVPILRATETEFSELGFQRVNSLEDVRELSRDASSHTLAVIVDESLVDDFLHSIPELKTVFPNTFFAVAYRVVDTARKLLAEQMHDNSLDNISYLPMNTQFDIWLSILRLILGGDGYVSRELWMEPNDTAGLPTGGHHVLPPAPVETALKAKLTDRELQVLGLVAEGKQNKTIACELGLSEHTVKLHIHHVIAKLDVHNRTEAAAWYFENRSLLRAPGRK